MGGGVESRAGRGGDPVMLSMSCLMLSLTLLPASDAVLNMGNPDAKRLYDDLLSNYNKLVRPVQNTTDPLTVRIKLKLSQLIDVVSFTSIFCLLGPDFVNTTTNTQPAINYLSPLSQSDLSWHLSHFQPTSGAGLAASLLSLFKYQTRY